ncbi:hypothetical protein [Dyadobacter sandarakinus]|uniref:hypothetical protein n=1 Tax=Dyadobacter sandarakinus TaxID=2747268 RepID=UPI00286E23EE|nr:hypothetical protein [Dyadobacter sandarakinus]
MPSLQAAKIRISPPSYTKIPESESEDLNVKAIAGSLLHWRVYFDQPAHVTVRLANSRGEEMPFKWQHAAFEYADKLAGSGLYSIKAFWKDSLIHQSDFYRLEAIPDLAPKIEPASKELYQYHLLKDEKTLKISARIADDFVVSQAFIVATVARGAGENVKFREVKFPLSVNFKSANFTKSIHLDELNFAPGDELYYYWAAIDNRRPEPNFSKSDTYFLVYKDTAQVEESQLATMAVNLVPEYFRSQRQIIIDTEKLIARRKKLAKQEFNSTSNEIGFDQKVLRLRYGQYLGEEFETSIGGGQHEEGDMVDAFTHHSDGSGEGAEQRIAEPVHDHGNEHKAGEAEDPLAALMEQYTHAHDDAETNTFYEQSTRSLLKMALEQMWQSELHLRMYEPEKALPFENKALEYLKTAQQKARAYVKKSGYDPPPIKEQEKRLTGEMKDLSQELSTEQIFKDQRMQQLASEMLGHLEPSKADKNRHSKMRQLAGLLSGRLIDSGPLHGGMQNWPVITSLQKLAGGRPLSAGENRELKAALYRYAGKSQQSGPAYSSDQKLEAAFRRRLR